MADLITTKLLLQLHVKNYAVSFWIKKKVRSVSDAVAHRLIHGWCVFRPSSSISTWPCGV